MLHLLTLLRTADVHDLLTVFTVEGREEREEAVKTRPCDVSSRLARVQASESRPASDAAAVQTTGSYQGTEFTICSTCPVH